MDSLSNWKCIEKSDIGFFPLVEQITTKNNNNKWDFRLKSENQRCNSKLNGGPLLRARRLSLLPFESVFRLIFISIGMLGEYITALDDNWRFVTIHNGQHMTMFGFFLIPTIFELLYYFRVTQYAIIYRVGTLKCFILYTGARTTKTYGSHHWRIGICYWRIAFCLAFTWKR